jgi:hypothetical protein
MVSYITHARAEKLLPRLLKKVIQLQELHEMLELMETVDIEIEETNNHMFHFLTQFNMSFHKLSYQFYHKLHSIEKMGCVVTDIEDGIISFLSHSGEKPIILSWQIDEPKIEYWHEVDEDFEDRKQFVNLLVE